MIISTPCVKKDLLESRLTGSHHGLLFCAVNTSEDHLSEPASIMQRQTVRSFPSVLTTGPRMPRGGREEILHADRVMETEEQGRSLETRGCAHRSRGSEAGLFMKLSSARICVAYRGQRNIFEGTYSEISLISQMQGIFGD